MIPISEEAQEKSGEKSVPARASRRLPEERLARKRQLDRQAQHDSRRKTKSYIAHLESIVKSLKQPNSPDTWITQIEEKRKLNEHLATSLRSIGRMAEAALRITGPELQATKTNETEESNTTEEDGVSLEYSGVMISAVSTMGDEPAMAYPGSQSEITQGILSQAGFLSPCFPSFAGEPWQIIENPFSKAMPVPGIRHHCAPFWLSTKQLMLQCKNIRSYPIIHEAADAEIPVQAVVFGWDTVERIYTLNPLWQLLRQTDERIFYTCTPSHRLAAMVLMHMKMKYILDPSHENLMALPAFLRPRPCQKFIEHNIAIDFHPWPGLREHLIFREHEFCTNDFSRAFHENHRFRWPFEFRDTYVKMPDTGLLQLSRTFLEHLYDLESWTMDAPFFEAFPEMRGEIPMTKTISNLLDPICAPKRPSIPALDYVSIENPVYTENPSSQMQGTMSTSDQTFATESAGLFCDRVDAAMR